MGLVRGKTESFQSCPEALLSHSGVAISRAPPGPPQWPVVTGQNPATFHSLGHVEAAAGQVELFNLRISIHPKNLL